MAELGQQTVELSTLVRRAAEDSFASLKELVEKSKLEDQSDAEKKISLLKFLLRTRQRMLRLHVLAKWCQQVPLVQYCQQLSSTLSNHDTCFTQAADSLFFTHEGLQQARAPIYDVPSAIEVLLSGSYMRLPRCIEDMGMQNALTEDEQKPALKKLDVLIRAKLLEAMIPEGISPIDISNGTVRFRVDGEFEVLLTLGYRGHLSLWRILHLELLVGERTGPVKLEDLRKYTLGDDLERRMAATDNPFVLLYSVLHELCAALIMDTVIRQVQVLRQGRWKDSIRFELISDGNVGQIGSMGSLQTGQDGDADPGGLRTPGVKIIYWLESGRSMNGGDLPPFIKIEPGMHLHIKCTHSTFIIDPFTRKEAQLCLNQACVDVEKLLLRAITCNRHTQLLAIYQELSKNCQFCLATGDINLKQYGNKPDAGVRKEIELNDDDLEIDEVLLVRAYGTTFFVLGINIRTGKFFMKAPRNTVSASILLNFEETFNQGDMVAAEVFLLLRRKSILTLFSSVGMFLGLKNYEENFAVSKVPKALLNSSDFLLMGFPRSGNSYHLLIQLDREFKAHFTLLESQTSSSRHSHPISSLEKIIRFNKIDVHGMETMDKLCFSLANLEKLQSSLSGHPDATRDYERVVPSREGVRVPIKATDSSQSDFASIVDEVFGHENGPAKSGSVASPHTDNSTTVLASSTTMNSLMFESTDLSSLCQPGGPPKSSSLLRLSLPSSDRDLSFMNSSLHSVDMDNDHKDQDRPSGQSQMDQSRNLSSPGINGFQGSPLTTHVGEAKANEPAARLEQAEEVEPSEMTDFVTAHDGKDTRKRTAVDFLRLIPSLQELVPDLQPERKKRKTKEFTLSQPDVSSVVSHGAGALMSGVTLCEAQSGSVSSNVYISDFILVVQHCCLCIKHARLTSQLEVLGIPFAEEVDLGVFPLNIWLRLPFAKANSWRHIRINLGSPGSMHWEVSINDKYFRDLWDLQKDNANSAWGSGVCLAKISDVDSHIRYAAEGVVLSYQSVQENSIRKLVSDIKRLFHSRSFALQMKKLLCRNGENIGSSIQVGSKNFVHLPSKLREPTRKAFKMEAIGLTSVWFSFGAMLGIFARFVVEWEAGKEGCVVHVSPDQLWPHTKFLEEFVDGLDVVSLLDCIILTAGPLFALAGAIRPARVPSVSPVIHCPGTHVLTSGPHIPQTPLTGNSSSNVLNQSASAALGSDLNAGGLTMGNNVSHTSLPGKSGPGIVPSSLLPTDVSVVLRGPYWIRVIYRHDFAVDMRCFAGDQVWLQPAVPSKGNPPAGGSMPCPQLMDHINQALHAWEAMAAGAHASGAGNLNNILPGTPNSQSSPVTNGSRTNLLNSNGVAPKTSQASSLNRIGTTAMPSTVVHSSGSGLPLRILPNSGAVVQGRDMNMAFMGFGDHGGYGGGWVPHAALKKVLRAILKYFGVLWLFAQLPALLKEIFGSVLKENEGSVLNLDLEQPLLHFFARGHAYAVCVHRVQLLLQVVSVRRMNQQNQTAHEELVPSEISEICDYFSRRVAVEPYDISRIASFVTLLTLPTAILRDFLRLIAWKKGLPSAQVQSNPEMVSLQRPRVELTLENHSASTNNENPAISRAKSSIHYDRANNLVEFGLTIMLDPSQVPYINAAGGASWLPYCVLVRMRYLFAENPHVEIVAIEGSHGGQACWPNSSDWEWCKQRITRAVEYGNSSAPGDASQGRLRGIADSLQRALQLSIKQLQDASTSSVST